MGSTAKNELPSVEFDFFIAHAAGDMPVAINLYDRLSRGYSVFLDAKSLVPGDVWTQRIPDAQQRSAITVVLISQHTDQAFYQQEEIANAIALARKYPAARRVVPVYLSSKLEIPEVPYGLRQVQSLYATETSRLKDVTGALVRSLRDLARQFALGRSGREYIEGTYSQEELLWWAHRAPLPSSDRAPENEIEAVLARVEASWGRRHSAYLMYADLDHFAGINQRFGTAIGDAIIKQVDTLVLETFRGGVAERMRKDEYLAVMGANGLDSFTKVVRSLRRRVAGFDWPILATDLYVTMSAGVVEVRAGERVSQATLRAIQGCRSVKRKGGNGVAQGPLALPKHVSAHIVDYSSE